MFYLLPNMPPILENSAEDEVTIAMVEFEKKRSLQRYSRYGATIPEDKSESERLANTLLKSGEISIAENDREYDNLANKMVCAKRIQYGAGFITLLSIIIVLILTTIKSGHSPALAPHSPQHGHSSQSNPSDLGFDAATGVVSSINSNDFDASVTENSDNSDNSDNSNKDNNIVTDNNDDINEDINDNDINNDEDNISDNNDGNSDNDNEIIDDNNNVDDANDNEDDNANDDALDPSDQ